VTVVNGPYVPGPDENGSATGILASFYNYPALGYPAVIFDLGTVTVQGSYKQIMDHVRSFSAMPHYLAVTDGLRIDGTSPNLTATYNLTVVGLLPPGTIYGTAPEAASNQSQGGFGGPAGPRGPGGPPPGIPTGKMGGPGGPTAGGGKMGGASN